MKAPKLTSDHLQPHVPFDVIEPTWDLYAAAVCTCIFCLHFPNRERHISIGNVALETVSLRFSERHPIPSGVQNFITALWIWAGTSAPAHIGDVLLSWHLVEARQLNRLPYYSSNNGFGCGVRCGGRTRKDERWQSPMHDSTYATQRGRERNTPACRQGTVTDPLCLLLKPGTANGPGALQVTARSSQTLPCCSQNTSLTSKMWWAKLRSATGSPSVE